MKIYRCLRRHDLATPPSDFIEMERKIKKFKRYGIGYLHIDLLHAPKINKERSYIYTAIDWVAKIAFVMLGKRKIKETGAKFLKQVLKFYPYKINYILTDNGFEFFYKALPKNKRTKKIHPLDKICQENKIERGTIKFKHLWTNGMIENFHGTIKDKALKRYLFETIFEMNVHLIEFINNYNTNARLKRLNFKTPAQYLKENKNIDLKLIKITN